MRRGTAVWDVLSKAGVPFAFMTQGVAANRFRENLRKVIGAGLPADAALAALRRQGPTPP